MIIFNKYKVINVKKFKRFIFISVLLISLTAFSLITRNAYSTSIAQFDYIEVEEGDTLWSIASNHVGNKEIREIIYEISEVNNIQDALIYPGDIIKIPLN